KFGTNGFVRSSPAIGSDGTIYFGAVEGSNGTLYALSDFTPPRVNLLSPRNTTYTIPNVQINASVYDPSGIDTVIAEVDGSVNVTLTLQNGYYVGSTPTLSNGQHSVRIYANDTFGNVNSSIFVYFNISLPALANSPWPKFQRDLNNTGFAPYPGLGEGSMKWNFTLGPSSTYGTRSSPVIGADGTIYTGSPASNIFYALYPNGTQKWNVSMSGGTNSAPAIASDGTIYIGYMSGYFFALYPNGTQKWNFTAGSGIVQSSPAIGSDGTVYFGSDDNNLYALYPNGTLRWSYTSGGAIRSSPAIASDGTVYVGTNAVWVQDYNLHAIYPNGTLRWKYTTEGLVQSPPAIASDGTVYFGIRHPYGGPANFYALYPNGTLNWNYTTGGYIESSPAIANDGTIYVVSYGFSGSSYLFAFYPNGSLKWKSSAIPGDVYTSSPAIANDGTVYVGTAGGIYAINPNDGTLRWSLPGFDSRYSSPAIASDGTVYINGQDSSNAYLFAFTDLTPPRVSIISPQNATHSNTTLQINISASDPSGVSSVIAEIDGSQNITLSPSAGYYTGTTPALTEGQHSIRIYANDSFGNVNASEIVHFTVSMAPSVAIISPQNTTYTSTSVLVNVSATDNNGISSVIAEIDGTINITLSPTAGYYTGTTPQLSNGQHYIRIYANDTLGSINSRELVYFTIDTMAVDVCKTINASGYYRLIKNITNPVTSPCIDITASNVILDAKGYVIDGTGSSGISIRVTNAINVTIKNAVITNWITGIYLYNVSDSLVTASGLNSITSNGIDLRMSSNNTITGNNISAGNYGISISDSSNNTVLENNVSNAGMALYILFSSGNLIANNTFAESVVYDIYSTSCQNTIIDNTGSGGREIGFYNTAVNLSNRVFSELLLCDADNSVLENITVSGSDIKKNNGIILMSDGVIMKNITSSNNRHGIYVFGDYNTISSSTLSNNSGRGIYFYYSSDYNVIDGCTLTFNGWDGIYFGAGSDDYNNITNSNISNNGNDGIEFNDDYVRHNIIANNTITHNAGDGIYFDEDYIDYNTIENNFIAFNGDDGIEFEEDGDDTVVRNNVIYNNSGDGIFFDWGDVNGYIIDSNNISGNSIGINCDASCGLSISGNSISENIFDGISFDGYDSSNLTGNTIARNPTGVGVNGIGNLIIIENNTFESNTYGVEILGEEARVYGNVFISNPLGVVMNSSYATGNSIYNNIFNESGAFDSAGNAWNTSKKSGKSIVGGKYIGGNWWSDYSVADADCDWIGDTPYNAGGNLSIPDYLPLIRAPLTLKNSSAVHAGTEVEVIDRQSNCHVFVRVSAVGGGSAVVNISAQVSPDSGTFGLMALNTTTSGAKAEKALKYVRIFNTSPLENVSRIRVELHYSDAEVSGMDEDTLAVFYWNGSAWLSTRAHVNSTLPGTEVFVYEAGVDTASNTAYAVVNSTSLYALGGLLSRPAPPPAATAPAAGGGGGGVYVPEAVLLANSIDLALAEELVSYLESLGIRLHIVNASNFSDYLGERYLIILGGHEAYEGVGEIVNNLTTEEERAEILRGRVHLKKRDAFRAGQKVYILAGKDRYETANAWRENYIGIAEEIKYGR
ncbi:MAG: PQQ-binding-like beta-propeller repeat protein, partial [Euryarchaeota archaeon]|nr:PQQ-binding-like beta-propeller repeat protein [Euryarchaeota archaeon]